MDIPVVVSTPPTATAGAAIATASTPAVTLRNINLSTESIGGVSFFAAIDSRITGQNLKGAENMVIWEYITTPLLLHKESEILNTWGAKGYELVSITTGPQGGLIAFMKRPKE